MINTLARPCRSAPIKGTSGLLTKGFRAIVSALLQLAELGALVLEERPLECELVEYRSGCCRCRLL